MLVDGPLGDRTAGQQPVLPPPRTDAASARVTRAARAARAAAGPVVRSRAFRSRRRAVAPGRACSGQGRGAGGGAVARERPPRSRAILGFVRGFRHASAIGALFLLPLPRAARGAELPALRDELRRGVEANAGSPSLRRATP